MLVGLLHGFGGVGVAPATDLIDERGNRIALGVRLVEVRARRRDIRCRAENHQADHVAARRKVVEKLNGGRLQHGASRAALERVVHRGRTIEHQYHQRVAPGSLRGDGNSAGILTQHPQEIERRLHGGGDGHGAVVGNRYVIDGRRGEVDVADAPEPGGKVGVEIARGHRLGVGFLGIAIGALRQGAGAGQSGSIGGFVQLRPDNVKSADIDPQAHHGHDDEHRQGSQDDGDSFAPRVVYDWCTHILQAPIFLENCVRVCRQARKKSGKRQVRRSKITLREVRNVAGIERHHIIEIVRSGGDVR